MMEEDPICRKCGEPRSAHGVDPMTMARVKCPVRRQEDPIRPRGDY